MLIVIEILSKKLLLFPIEPYVELRFVSICCFAKQRVNVDIVFYIDDDFLISLMLF